MNEDLTKLLDGTEEPEDLIDRGRDLINSALQLESGALGPVERPFQAEQLRRHAFDLFTLANTLRARTLQDGQMSLMAACERWMERAVLAEERRNELDAARADGEPADVEQASQTP